MTIDFASRVRGCLLGGSLGDQLGYAVEFSSWNQIQERFGPDGLRDFSQLDFPGHISDDTQLTLYTVDAVVEALEWANDGTAADETALLWLAYLRWYAGQEGGFPDSAPQPAPRWIDAQPVLKQRRDPGKARLSGLATGEMGTLARPVNPQSKGCGSVVRSAPFGLLPFVTPETVYTFAVNGSALTHGHPAAHHSAAAFASLIRLLVHENASFSDAAAAVLTRAEQETSVPELAARLRAAIGLAEQGVIAPAELPAALGEGWVAEEALAVALYAVLVTAGSTTPEEHFRSALTIAINHDGDSDSTGSIAGNILGAFYGEAALPPSWVDAAEAPGAVLGMAARFLTQTQAPA
ncbi:ADP-ribosylglycohydrolase family protein [Arthrobacter sp. VKM Ac-2550]|uniref:ADP-ribosylglycohydrolase family protein n=1 Tax=Crystallibacter permensis TaxID=1938888 RepID=UPI0022276459|nr:ADP-ribosylglycohydrolase family protein [Arthrobacter sp. VKM Ac-2550]MCW2132605.1 ADP-ribosylglycohydrolase [Arthrobacter sp. VKM Ac-2550]